MLCVVIRDRLHIIGEPGVDNRSAACLRGEAGRGRIVLRQRRQIDRFGKCVVKVKLYARRESLPESPLHRVIMAGTAGTKRSELAVLAVEDRIGSQHTTAKGTAGDVEIVQSSGVIAALRLVQVVNRLRGG